MTISTTVRKAGPFIGNGTASSFPFAFKVFAATDLEVVVVNASGVQTTLLLYTDYTVALNLDQNASPGGTVTLVAGPLATGNTMVITSDIPELQQTDLSNQGGFYPSVIMDALDKLTILVQQLSDAVVNSLQIPIFESTNMVLPAVAQRAGKMLIFDSNGDPQLVTMAASAAAPGSQEAVGTIDGANKVFTFTAAQSVTPPAVLVFVAGVYQTLTTDYGAPVFVSGSTWQITFTDAPVRGPITILMFA